MSPTFRSPILVVLTGFAVAGYLYSLLQANAQRTIEAKFNGAVRANMEVLRLGEKPYVNLMYQLADSFEASEEVSRKEFNIITRRALEVMPGMRAVDWLPKTSGLQRKGIEDELSQLLGEKRTLQDKGDGHPPLVKAANKELHFPLFYIEPFEQGRPVFGLDITSVPEQKATLEESLKRLRPLASPPLHPAQNPNGELHVVVLFPVFDRPRHRLEGKSSLDNLEGFLQFIIEVPPLIESILQRVESSKGIEVQIHASNLYGEEKILHERSVKGESKKGVAELSRSDSFYFVGREWKIDTKAVDGELYPAWSGEILILPILITLLGLFTGLFLYRLITRERDLQIAKEVAESSRQKMTALFEALPIGVVMISEDGTIVEANQITEEVLGLSTNDQRMRELQSEEWDIVHPDGTKMLVEEYPATRALQGEGVIKNVQMGVKRPQGDLVWIRTSASPVQNGDGGVAVAFQDITELEKARLVIEKNEERFRSLTNNVQGVIYRCKLDEDDTMIFLNPYFEHLTGYPVSEILGENSSHKFVDFIHPEDLGKVREGIEEALKTNGAYSLHYRIIHRDGHLVHVYEMGHASFERMDDFLDGKPDYLDGFIVDISDRVETERALAKAKDAAEAATKAKGDFLANMSHEIRTPMNAIIGLSHLALNTELTRKQRDYLSKISAASNNLLGIINDILDFSKIEAGKMEMESIPFDLAEAMDHFSNVVAVKAAEKDLEFIVDIQENVPLDVKGDALRLNQVLVNLANNAVKFTKEGEVVVKVERMLSEKDKITLKFSVKDSGIGMTDEQQSKLFQAFSQADSSTTRKFGGTGLGLTISKSLVEKMGGEIGVESKAGEGSTFYFTADFGACPAKKRRDKLALPMDVEGLKVLIVDDNATARTIFSRYLESFGLIPVSVESGEDALEHLVGSEKYELVLMDWNMPGMNGLETIKRIRENAKIVSKPQMILVSAYGREELREEAQTQGVETYLVKPVNPSTLLDGILETMGHDVEYTTVHTKIEEDMGFQGLHLLLVEDNEINQQVAEEILEDQGIRVTIADNGQLGVEALMKSPEGFDGVLMDIQMPVMDGYTAAKKIREDRRFENLPIIAMTANAMAGDREKALEVGMNDHVAKPIDVNDLFGALAKYIEPRKLTEEPSSSKEDAKPLELPRLEGLDTVGGLARVGGKVSLFLKILNKFRDGQRDAIKRAKAAAESGDVEAAVREVHTLKGLAGNIGAKRLQEKAALLEKLLNDMSSPLVSVDVFEGQTWGDCDHELQEVLKTLSVLELQPEQDFKHHGKNIENLESELNRLQELLEEDDAESVEKLQEIQAALPQGMVRDMSEHMDQYDFEEALEIFLVWKSSRKGSVDA